MASTHTATIFVVATEVAFDGGRVNALGLMQAVLRIPSDYPAGVAMTLEFDLFAEIRGTPDVEATAEGCVQIGQRMVPFAQEKFTPRPQCESFSSAPVLLRCRGFLAPSDDCDLPVVLFVNDREVARRKFFVRRVYQQRPLG